MKKLFEQIIKFGFVGAAAFIIDYKITKIIATFIVMIWNFVTRKIFLESKK